MPTFGQVQVPPLLPGEVPPPPPPVPINERNHVPSYYMELRPKITEFGIVNPLGIPPKADDAKDSRVAVSPSTAAATQPKTVAIPLTAAIQVPALLKGPLGKLDTTIRTANAAVAPAGISPAAALYATAGASSFVSMGEVGLGSRSSRNAFNMMLAQQGIVTDPKKFNSLTPQQQENQKLLATQQATLVQAGLAPVKVGDLNAPVVQQDAPTPEQQNALAAAGLPTDLAVESLAPPDQQATAEPANYGYTPGPVAVAPPRPMAPVAPVLRAPTPTPQAQPLMRPPVVALTPSGQRIYQPPLAAPASLAPTSYDAGAAPSSDSFLSAPVTLPVVGTISTGTAILGGAVLALGLRALLRGRSGGRRSRR